MARYSRQDRRALRLILLVTLLPVLFGAVFAAVYNDAIGNPTDSMNTVNEELLTPGSNESVQLPPSHYFIVWRSDLPSHDASFSWQVRLRVWDAGGAEVANLTSSWTEYETHTSGRSGTTYNDPPGHLLWDGELDNGGYQFEVDILTVSSSTGAGAQAVWVHFNDPARFADSLAFDRDIGIAVAAAGFLPLIIWIVLRVRRARTLALAPPPPPPTTFTMPPPPPTFTMPPPGLTGATQSDPTAPGPASKGPHAAVVARVVDEPPAAPPPPP